MALDVHAVHPEFVDTILEARNLIAKQYESLIDGSRVDYCYTPTGYSKDLLADLDLETAKGVLSTVNNILSLLPESLFLDRFNHPTSTTHLNSLMYVVYKQGFEENHKKFLFPLCANLLLQSSKYYTVLKNRTGLNTAEITSNFLGGSMKTSMNLQNEIDEVFFYQNEFNRQNFGDYLTRLIISTIDIDQFNNKFGLDILERWLRAYEVTYIEYVNRLCPDKEFSGIARPIIITHGFGKSGVASNYLNYKQQSNQKSKIMGVSSSWERDYVFNTVSLKDVLKGSVDASMDLISTIIHEDIHSLNNDRSFSYPINQINELLTDSAAEIMLLETEGRSFVNVDSRKFRAGYTRHKTLAQQIMKADYITQDELLTFAFGQDPEGFLSLLSDRFRSKSLDDAMQIVKYLWKDDFIGSFPYNKPKDVTAEDYENDCNEVLMEFAIALHGSASEFLSKLYEEQDLANKMMSIDKTESFFRDKHKKFQQYLDQNLEGGVINLQGDAEDIQMSKGLILDLNLITISKYCEDDFKYYSLYLDTETIQEVRHKMAHLQSWEEFDQVYVEMIFPKVVEGVKQTYKAINNLIAQSGWSKHYNIKSDDIEKLVKAIANQKLLPSDEYNFNYELDPNLVKPWIRTYEDALKDVLLTIESLISPIEGHYPSLNQILFYIDTMDLDIAIYKTEG